VKPIGIDPPPSRRVVDRYGFFGILYGALLLFAMGVALLVVALWHGAVWLVRRLKENLS
jgi:hypothetical protein